MSGARCAFLLMQNPEGWQIDAGLAIPYLEAAGWQVDWVPWRDDVDWGRYQLVYPAAAWDYPDAPQLFSDTLTKIERAGARLVNAADTLRWNIDKRYLRDLEAAGAAIVPSAWFDDDASFDARALAARWAVDKVIAKPVIGTNAIGTRVIEPEKCSAPPDFAGAAFFAQPFIEGIATEGEYSLFFMGGDFSHAIRKVPAEGDYRVQEEYGARLELTEVDGEMRAAAITAIDAAPTAPAYARCDLIRYEGSWRVMELELIEPSMYLRMQEDAPQRFAAALIEAAAN